MPQDVLESQSLRALCRESCWEVSRESGEALVFPLHDPKYLLGQGAYAHVLRSQCGQYVLKVIHANLCALNNSEGYKAAVQSWREQPFRLQDYLSQERALVRREYQFQSQYEGSENVCLLPCENQFVFRSQVKMLTVRIGVILSRYQEEFRPFDSLLTDVETMQQMQLAALIQIFDRIINAVTDCYQRRKGIVHRDLTPGNILLSSDQAKLIDFGIAQVKGEKGEQFEDFSIFLPPERCEVHRVSRKEDVYLLAITFIMAFMRFVSAHAKQQYSQVNRFYHAKTYEVLIDAFDHFLEGLNAIDSLPKTDFIVAYLGFLKRCLARQPEERPSFSQLKATVKLWAMPDDISMDALMQQMLATGDAVSMPTNEVSSLDDGQQTQPTVQRRHVHFA